MDIIKLTNIVFYAHHGYYDAERELGQRFELDIEVECDLKPAAAILKNREIKIIVNLNSGNEKATAYGCDLSYDYVKINAEYN